MHQKYVEDEKINIATMYINKYSCDWFLWWDSKCVNIGFGYNVCQGVIHELHQGRMETYPFLDLWSS